MYNLIFPFFFLNYIRYFFPCNLQHFTRRVDLFLNSLQILTQKHYDHRFFSSNWVADPEYKFFVIYAFKYFIREVQKQLKVPKFVFGFHPCNNNCYY
jgi:hypothetical protein